MIKNVTYYTKVRIVGYSDVGSIHLDEYIAPYSEGNRPRPGTIINGKILNKQFDNKKNQDVWSITMDIHPEDIKIEKTETAMAQALKRVNIN